MVNRFFLSLWLATCAKYRCSTCKTFRIAACCRNPLVPDYAHETPHAPVENGYVFSAARRGRRAVGQFEIPGGAPWVVACHRVPGYQSLSRCKIDSAPHPGARPASCPGAELPAEFHGSLAALAAEFHHRRGGAGDQRWIRGSGHVRN